MRRRTDWKRQAATAVCMAGIAWVGAAHAAYTVSGSPATLADGSMDLQCEDLVVTGTTLTVTNYTFQNVGHIIIGRGASIAATNSTFDVAVANVQNNGIFTGASYTRNYSCGGGGTNPLPSAAPVPSNGPLGLALMSLLLGAAIPARRWLGKRRQNAR